MAEASTAKSDGADASGEARIARTCDRCGRPLTGKWRFSLDGETLCVRCVARHGKLLRRSFLTAVVVGSVLTAINSGDVIFSGGALSLAWKIPLTYSSPFLVATWGGIVNARMREPTADAD